MTDDALTIIAVYVSTVALVKHDKLQKLSVYIIIRQNLAFYESWSPFTDVGPHARASMLASG